MGAKTIVYIDHSTIKYLFDKKDVKPKIIHWILSLQEFNNEIKYKKGLDNMVADHLSRLENRGSILEQEINKESLYEHLFALFTSITPWFVDFMNYLTCGILPPDLFF